MKLTNDEGLRAGRRIGLCLIALLLGIAPVHVAQGQGVSTTTVQGTVYLANGQPGAGTLAVSWPAFTTAAGQAVAADSTTVTIAADGFVSVNLAPNVGATPAGEYYTAIFYMSDGTVSTQYWVVPAAAQASLAQVQAQVMPSAQAVQTVSKAYVDQAVAEAAQSQLTASGGSLTGPLYLSGDPTQELQAADKHYVDTAVATAVPLAGGTMTGALATPAVNGVQAPAAGSGQTTLQAAMTAAGTNGAMEIPPTYAGTDTFTNPNGVRVTDLRTHGSQQVERSVKEFGAVCDGVTDDTNALQAALNYADTHGVALTIPEGTCKTHSLNWHGESIGGLGKQVSALMGFPGQDVLASVTDSPNLLEYTRIHDLTIYVDQSEDVSCTGAEGRAPAGSCQVSRPVENNSIFSPGGNGLTGTAGTGAAWSVGNCAIAMPAVTGTVSSGNSGQIAYYTGNGTSIGGMSTVPLTAGGTGASSASGALANMGGVPLSGGTMAGTLSGPNINAGTVNAVLNVGACGTAYAPAWCNSPVIEYQSSGSGYSGTWTCAVTGGTVASGGSAATCSATVTAANGLYFTITSPGTYTSAPTGISFTGGTYTAGTAATATLDSSSTMGEWINAALANCAATGCTIEVPATSGTMTLNEPIPVTTANVTLKCDTRNTMSTNYAYSAMGPNGYYLNPIDVTAANFEMEGCHVDVSSLGRIEEVAVNLWGATNAKIHGNTFTSSTPAALGQFGTMGVRAQGSATNQSQWIDVYDNTISVPFIGLSTGNFSYDVNFHDNSVSNSYECFDLNGGGSTGANPNLSASINVTNNQCLNNLSSSYVESAYAVTIKGNFFWYNGNAPSGGGDAQAALRIHAITGYNAENVLVDSNQFYGNSSGAYGVDVYNGANNVQIANNQFYSTGLDAILIDGSEGAPSSGMVVNNLIVAPGQNTTYAPGSSYCGIHINTNGASNNVRGLAFRGNTVEQAAYGLCHTDISSAPVAPQYLSIIGNDFTAPATAPNGNATALSLPYGCSTCQIGPNKLDDSGTSYLSGMVSASSASLSGESGSSVRATALAAPSAPTGTASGSAGSLAAGTYYAKVVAVDGNGLTTTAGSESAGATLTATGEINWSWAAVAGAAWYQLWVGSASGGENTYVAVPAGDPWYTQTAALGTGTIPTVNQTGTVTAGTTGTPTYPANSTASNQLTPYQFNNSRYGRVSVVSTSGLIAAMANYNFTTQPTIYIPFFGESIIIGASLTDPNTTSACARYAADLKADFPGPGGLGYNFKCINMGVNGTVANQFPAAWQVYTTYALSGVTIASSGTGYAVGDWFTPNEGTNQECGSGIVTSVGGGGVVTGIAISTYPGSPSLSDTYTNTTCLYATGTNIPTVNGPAPQLAIYEQTGTGSGLTVNITAVGYPAPAEAVIEYGMNNGGPLLFNSAIPVSSFESALAGDIQTLQQSNPQNPPDVVDMTIYHNSVVWSGPPTWSPAINCTVPDFMSTCNSTGAPSNTSTVNAATSTSTGDFAHLGTQIAIDSRRKVLNDASRRTAAKYGASLIDLERYWFELMETKTAALGSQLAAEQYLFNVAGPHVNNNGEQVYYNAIDDFVNQLAEQTAQSSNLSALPQSSTSGNVYAYRQMLDLGSISTSATFAVPAMATGKIILTAYNYFHTPTRTEVPFTSNQDLVSLGNDSGNNTSGSFALMGALSTTNLTATVTVNASSTVVGGEIDYDVYAGQTTNSTSGGTSTAGSFTPMNGSGISQAQGFAASTSASSSNANVTATATGSSSGANFTATSPSSTGSSSYCLVNASFYQSCWTDIAASAPGVAHGQGWLTGTIGYWLMSVVNGNDLYGYVPQGYGATGTGAAWNILHSGNATFAAVTASSLQTTAGTVGSLPACDSTTVAQRRTVTDATAATPGSAAAGGGTYTIAVECIYNSTGPAYSWIID